MIISNLDSAFKHAQNTLRKSYVHNWFQRIPKNKGRHLLLKSCDPKIPNFYVLFKNDFFHLFNEFCPEFVKDNPSCRGLGESINEESLNEALRNNAYLLYVYPNGSIYGIHPKMIYKSWSDLPPIQKSELLRKQKKSNEYRLRDGSGMIAKIFELEFLFPIKWLERLNE